MSEFGDPPEWMGDAGKVVWELLASELQDSVSVDRPAMILACSAYDAAERALRDLAERGPLITGDRGMVKNPANQVAREQSAAFRAWCEQFGLTPAARKRLGIETKKDKPGAGLID